jgi:hypothetical protein
MILILLINLLLLNIYLALNFICIFLIINMNILFLICFIRNINLMRFINIRKKIHVIIYFYGIWTYYYVIYFNILRRLIAMDLNHLWKIRNTIEVVWMVLSLCGNLLMQVTHIFLSFFMEFVVNILNHEQIIKNQFYMTN